MKGTIIGTDLLQKDDSVQVIEINTNTTIFNSGAELLDYDPLFSHLNNSFVLYYGCSIHSFEILSNPDFRF